MATTGSYSITIRAIDSTSTVVAKINKSLVQQNKVFADLNRSAKALGVELKRSMNITGITSITRSVRQFGSQIAASVKSTIKLGAALLGITGAASAAGIAALAAKFGAFIFNLEQTAARIGVAPKSLEDFGNAAHLAGIDIGTATAALESLGSIMEDAVNGRNPAAMASFKQLGIDIQGIGVFAKDPLSIMPILARKFAAMGDSAGAAAAKMRILRGLGLQDLLPLLNLGEKGYNEYLKTVQKYSVYTKENADAARRLRLEQATLGLSLGALGEMVSKTLEPALTALYKIVQPIIDRMLLWLKNTDNQRWLQKQLADAINLVTDSVTKAWRWIDNIVTKTVGWKVVLIALGAILAAAVALPILKFFVAPLFIAGKAVLGIMNILGFLMASPVIALTIAALLAIGIVAYEIWKHWDVILPFLKRTWQWILDMSTAYGVWIAAAWDRAWKAIRDSFWAALGWIEKQFSDFGDFVGNIWSWIEKQFSDFGDYVGGIWTDMTTRTLKAWEALKKSLSDIWKAISDTFWGIWTPVTDGFIKAWTKVGDFFDKLWDGIVAKFKETYESLSSVINKFVDMHLLPESMRVEVGTGGGATAPGNNANAPPSGQLPSGDKDKLASESYDFWRSKGYTAQAASGMVASEDAESGFQPRPGDIDKNGIARAGGSFQWHQDRREAIQKATGIDTWDPKITHAQQLAAAYWEQTQGGEKSAGDKIRGATTAADAGDKASRYYERPGDVEGQARIRAGLAASYYNRFTHGEMNSNDNVSPIAGKPANGEVHVKVDFSHVPSGVKTSSSTTGAGLRLSQSRTAGALI
jgi:hypothetical protein